MNWYVFFGTLLIIAIIIIVCLSMYKALLMIGDRFGFAALVYSLITLMALVLATGFGILS